jgi:hypothetical protein
VGKCFVINAQKIGLHCPKFHHAFLSILLMSQKSEGWEATMGTPLTPMQKCERDIEGLRQSIRQMFRDLSNLTLAPEDRAAITRGIQSLQDDLRWEQEKFERGG